MIQRQRRPLGLLPALLLLGACASGVAGGAPAGTRMDGSAAPEGEWRSYSGPSESRYSPLSQIDASNVSRLDVAWEWEARSVLGDENEYRNQSTPLMVGGVLYFTAGTQRVVIAADAATGETKWVWRFDDPRNEIAPRANSGRGVSYWEEGDDRRILVLTPGYRLVALNAETGVPVPTFGENGSVDLKRVLGAPDDAVIGASSPVAIYRNVAVVGPALAVGTAPPSRNNVAGSVMAFDVRTGAELWRFRTIPQAGEFGNDTWENDSWTYTGNAGVWAPITTDHERGIFYLPVEGATGDYYGGHRLGDNLFSSSVLALNALTGERIWHFQTVHHDILDYDNPTAPLLADFEMNGRRVSAVVQLTKQAIAYVFDRVTGEPVWPIVETPVPPSDVPGERASTTQPIPTKPAGYDRQGVTINDLIDYTPALRAEALEAIRPFRLGAFFAPPSERNARDGTEGTLSLPGTLGGTNWEGGAFDPSTGLLFVGSYTNPTVLSMVSDTARSDMNMIMSFGRVPRIQGLPLMKPPYSRITAIDLKTGDHAWMVAAGETPDAIRNNPALAGVTLPRTGSVARPVLLATRTLLFQGEGSGGLPVLHVLDKESGREIWSRQLDAPITSNPMSYELGGRQYVAFWIGEAGMQVRSRLVVMALPA